MKRGTLRIAAAALALILTGCAAADTSTAANVEMRVQDGYIQYYNGTVWENLISTEELKGEKGDKGDPGEKGERGETGPQGPKGEKGDKGDPGANGLNGADGKDGKDGANGKDGTNGKDGVNGKDGRDGVDGKDGIPSIPGITQEFVCDARNYYDSYDYTSTYGYIQVNSAEKAVVNPKTTFYNAHNNTQQISFLMNEDGRFTVTAIAESGWQFIKWSDEEINPTRTISYTNKPTLHAYFEPVTPSISWDPIKPIYCEAELSHPYSAVEPWIDISYINHTTFDPQSPLGGGIFVEKGENEQLGKYISIKHSATTTIRYGNLSAYPTNDLNSYVNVDGSFSGVTLPLTTTQQSNYNISTLRIQVLVNGEVVDPETVLPPLSTVDWLYAKGQAPRPTPEPALTPSEPVYPTPEPTTEPTQEPTTPTPIPTQEPATSSDESTSEVPSESATEAPTPTPEQTARPASASRKTFLSLFRS